MDNEFKKWTNYISIVAESDEEAVAYLFYVEQLLDKKVPVIFESAQLAKLL